MSCRMKYRSFAQEMMVSDDSHWKPKMRLSFSASLTYYIACRCSIPVGVVLCSSNVYFAILGRLTSQTCKPLSDNKAQDAISLSYPGRHCIRDTDAMVRIVYCGFLLSEFMSHTFDVAWLVILQYYGEKWSMYLNGPISASTGKSSTIWMPVYCQTGSVMSADFPVVYRFQITHIPFLEWKSLMADSLVRDTIRKRTYLNGSRLKTRSKFISLHWIKLDISDAFGFSFIAVLGQRFWITQILSSIKC